MDAYYIVRTSFVFVRIITSVGKEKKTLFSLNGSVQRRNSRNITRSFAITEIALRFVTGTNGCAALCHDTLASPFTRCAVEQSPSVPRADEHCAARQQVASVPPACGRAMQPRVRPSRPRPSSAAVLRASGRAILAKH